jgi:hypothetical protein
MIYVVAAWHSHSTWASPVISIKSILLSEDASVDMRSIENFNLLTTTRHHILAGQGYGHPYEEISKGISISEFLKAYLYLPHNSILWLMSAGGILFFTGYWMLFTVGVFFALKVYHISRDDTDKIAAIITVLSIDTYAVQAMGDFGIHSWLSIMVMTPLLGIMGARAAKLNIWSQNR